MSINAVQKSVLVTFSLSASFINAYNPYIEAQAMHSEPWQHRALDSSFMAPFEVAENIEQSQAIFGWLDSNDVDVVSFTVTSPALVSASAMPSACEQSQDLYPRTALVGPMVASAQFAPPPENLPFALPEGYGILIASNPEVPSLEPRPVYQFSAAPNVAWFLPQGLTEECLRNDPLSCNYANTVAKYLTTPGTYYIVTWDPHGQHQDYTLKLGFSNEQATPNEQTEELVRDHKWMHSPCTKVS